MVFQSGVRGGESASPAEQYKIDKNGLIDKSLMTKIMQ